VRFVYNCSLLLLLLSLAIVVVGVPVADDAAVFFFICLLLLCLLLLLLSVNDCTHCCCSGSYVYRNKITRGNSITDFHLHLPHQFPLLGREEKTFSLLPMAKVEKRAVTYFFCINTH